MHLFRPHDWSGWHKRGRALRHIPALLKLAWDSGPHVISMVVAGRVICAMVPLAMLTVSKQIFDAVQARFAGEALRPDFWWLVGLECGLAVGGGVLGRATGFFAGVFADRLARPPVQPTDRVAMVQAIGTMLQQSLVAVTLSLAIISFSPWLLVLLVIAVIPVLIGETHFALLGYSLNIRQTPVRRQLDYLRMLGASKEAAKELKLFGLAPFVTTQYAQLSDQLYDQNVQLARRRLLTGALLSLVSTSAYYGAYAYVIYRTISGDLSWVSLQFVAGGLARARNNPFAGRVTGAHIADQSLFLTDLLEFFAV